MRDLIEKISLKIDIDFKDYEHAKIIYNTILPETNSSPNDRSIVSAKLIDKQLKLSIDSKDFINLRAVINSYLKWFTISLQIINETINQL